MPTGVEILLVAFVIYRFLLFLVGTRAMQMTMAAGFIVVVCTNQPDVANGRTSRALITSTVPSITRLAFTC